MTIFNRHRSRFSPEFVAGAISANNTNPSGAAPVSSAVAIDVSDASTVMIQVAGTHGGAKALQASIDGTNWITLAGAQVIRNEATGVHGSSIASGAVGIFSVDVTGFVKFRVSAPTTGTTGSATVTMFTAEQPVAVALDGGQTTVAPAPASIPAPTGHTLVSAATVNATSVKAAPGRVTGLMVSNLAASARFLKLYDKASAPTVGTDTPVAVIPLPANSVVAPDISPFGMFLQVGIAYAITGAQPVADTTVIGAGEVLVQMSYY